VIFVVFTIDRSSIDIDKKNTINNHSKSYFTNVVEKDFYPCFSQLENFIRLKENKELQEKLESKQHLLYQALETFYLDVLTPL
jgi:hypothetical protein